VKREEGSVNVRAKKSEVQSHVAPAVSENLEARVEEGSVQSAKTALYQKIEECQRQMANSPPSANNLISLQQLATLIAECAKAISALEQIH